MAEFVAAVRSANTGALGTPKETGFRADIREANVYDGYNEAQVWRGYFTAPVTGTYTFRGYADDSFRVYLATTYGSTELPTDPLIYSNTHQYMYYPFANDISTSVANASLEAGKSYNIEVYHINSGSYGYVDISTQVPNTNSSARYQTYQVDKMSTNSTVQP